MELPNTVREVTNGLPNPARNSTKIPWYIHVFFIFLLDILLIYYLTSSKSFLCLSLSIGLWWLAVEDYKSQNVDIRVCGVFFLIGLMIHQGNAIIHLYLGIVGFLAPHVIHEAMASVEKTDSDTGKIDYESKEKLPLDKAPAYIPLFTGSLILVLGYYLLGLPLAPKVQFVVFSPFPSVDFPAFLWIIPIILAIISFYYYCRNKKKMQEGYNIIYRGVGDGDIYFIGVLIGVLGFFLTLLTVFISLFPAGLLIQKWNKAPVAANRNK